MELQSIINLIELVAIAVGAAFGVLGSVTRTKDSNGRLTRWGIVAVAGILLTNSFSFVNNYLKQQNAAESKIRAQAAEIEKIKTDQAFRDNVIRKSDQSLTTQITIQDTISHLLESFRTSIKTQNRILGSNKTINENVNKNLYTQMELVQKQGILAGKQDTLLRDMNRQMFKLNNAAMAYEISFDCYGNHFKDFTNQVMDSAMACIARKKSHEDAGFYNEKLGISGYYRVENNSFKITRIDIDQHSSLIPGKSFYSEELNQFNTQVFISRKDIRNSEWTADAELDYEAKAWNEKSGYIPLNLNNYTQYTGSTQINYRIYPETKRISFFVQTTRVLKSSDKTGKILSLLDLPGTYAKIFFFGDTDLGKSMNLDWFEMDFGENYSWRVRFTSADIEKVKPQGMFFYYQIKKENIFR